MSGAPRAARGDRPWRRAAQVFQRLLSIIRLGWIERILDLGPVDDLEPPVLHLRDELLAEALMDLADELLGALRCRNPLVEPLDLFQGLDQRPVVFRGGVPVAALLDGLLDDKQGVPAPEHMRIGGDILGVPETRAGVVDAPPIPVEALVRRGVAARVPREGLPEVRPLQVLEPGAREIDPFERVDEPADLGPPRPEGLPHLLDEGQ